jgi:hypothetical protein
VKKQQASTSVGLFSLKESEYKLLIMLVSLASLKEKMKAFLITPFWYKNFPLIFL